MSLYTLSIIWAVMFMVLSLFSKSLEADTALVVAALFYVGAKLESALENLK